MYQSSLIDDIMKTPSSLMICEAMSTWNVMSAVGSGSQPAAQDSKQAE